ncbi:Rho termination factor N-terminal domain-containing protein [Synechocystis salina]
MRELKQRARRAKIKGYGSMRKAELVQHLLASPTERPHFLCTSTTRAPD